MLTWKWGAAAVLSALTLLVLTAAGTAAEPIIMRTATAVNENPFEAGKAAALLLSKRLEGNAPQVVILADCFEDKENKQEVLKGVTSVVGADKVVGGAYYGMFTQEGTVDQDAVALLGIAGTGLTVATALEKDMGAAGLSLEKDPQRLTAALHAAGQRLARKFSDAAEARLLILLADAHVPKNQLLLDGVQAVLGKKLAITGASVNKNAQQSWVYYRGSLYTDSAVAILLRGPLAVAQAGRQAKENDRVLATARDSAGEAVKKLGTAPLAVLAFDCAGRKGKLKNVGEELAAMQGAIGKEVVLFGCYGAGEYGPPDTEDVKDKSICCGRGWHVMISALGR